MNHLYAETIFKVRYNKVYNRPGTRHDAASQQAPVRPSLPLHAAGGGLPNRCRIPVLAALALIAGGCGLRSAGTHALPSGVIPHSAWEAEPRLGHAAHAVRRNLGAGEALEFGELAITVVATEVDSAAGAAPVDVVRLRLERDRADDERVVREGAAFNWGGYHIAVVAVYGPGELGAGLVALEVAMIQSLPPSVAASPVAGGAAMRLRVPHRITHVTLHHTGSVEPLRPQDDAVAKLRGLQAWGARDRNWWDLPYHFLIDLSGRVYEGRDWRYMGETNTTYDPSGHFLISVLGNYDLQEPTPAQIEAIADLMAWALDRFDLPLERIGGHYDYAETDCPGHHLRPYLEDGTLQRMVAARLSRGAEP